MNAVDNLLTISTEFTYDLNRKFLYDLKKHYPFAEFSVIGRTWAGRGIFSMSIGEGSESVLLLGGQKGQEGITSLILYRLFEKLCDTYESGNELCEIKIRKSLKERKIVFVPCLNPDSIEIAKNGSAAAGCYRGLTDLAASGDYSKWNSNARGVDISYNFAYNHRPIIFGDASKKPAPAPFCYAGPSPESEPETKAISTLCERMNFRQAFLLSCGNDQIIWSDDLEQSRMIAKVLSAISGYRLKKQDEYESFGSFCGWFSKEFNRSAFEVKTGDTKDIATSSDFDAIYDKVEEMLFLGAIL